MLTLAALLSLTTSAAAQTPAVDYDANDDGYISVGNLAQLNAIRHDLDGNGARDSITTTVWANYTSAFPNAATGMGCPATGCVGYELTQSLDLDENSDGEITQAGDPTYWNSGAGWAPIGDATTQYSGDFKGNGNTINNLFINRTTLYNGLFGVTAAASRIETLGVTNANIRGSTSSGILIGANQGAVVACYTTGKLQASNNGGGLAGANLGTISASYSTAYVNGNGAVQSTVGGLVGYQQSGAISESYSTGRVARTAPSGNTGGLIGNLAAGAISNSYWDTSTSGQTTSAGGSGAVGKTTRQLQSVTSYTGIYANWNTNLDGVTGNDNPWAFGNKMQYPMLDYKSMSTTPQNSQAMGIADNWNAPIVGERVAVCVTGATRSSRSGGWQWEKSTNGDTWTALSRNSGATYEYYPVSADVGSYLRAKAPLSGGGFAYTRALGGRVKQTSAATAGSAISFVSGNTSPRVGQKIQASDPAPAGAVDRRYSWQRCDNADTTYTDCSYIYGVWWTNYTPVAADLNKYLRMIVYYETSAGVWTRHATAFTGQVAAASQ